MREIQRIWTEVFQTNYSTAWQESTLKSLNVILIAEGIPMNFLSFPLNRVHLYIYVARFNKKIISNSFYLKG